MCVGDNSKSSTCVPNVPETSPTGETGSSCNARDHAECSDHAMTYFSDRYVSKRKLTRELNHVVQVYHAAFSECYDSVRDHYYIFLDTGAGLTCMGRKQLENLRRAYQKFGRTIAFKARKRSLTVR